MDWITDALHQLWIDAVNWFSWLVSQFTSWINQTWAWIVSPLYTPLRDLLPSIPEFRVLVDWVVQSDAVAWVQILWWAADQVLYVNVVAPALAALVTLTLVVWAYRAWMIVKQAVPFAG